MAITDIFPLTPFFPLQRKKVDRKIRQRMESGKLYIRSKGTDLWQIDLTGLATSANIVTLQTFYEAQAQDIFTFQDKSFNPEVDRVVAFGATLQVDETAYEYFIWRVTLVETTLA